MLDIKLIREKKEDIQKSLSKRGCEKDFNLDEIIETDNARRRLIVEVEKLKAEINKYSNAKPDPETIQQLRIVSNKIKKIDRQLFEVGKEYNKVLKIFGKKFKFKFTPRDHIQLANDLELIDYERGAKMSGSGFWVYKGKGALLEWALLNYFIDRKIGLYLRTSVKI